MKENKSKKTGYIESQYNRHAQHFENSEEFSPQLVNAWLAENTADSWRHSRAYEATEILHKGCSDSWLTIGDGRWGLDSVRIRRLSAVEVLPTDISETYLKKAKDSGIIAQYRVENAENLSFEDESFDYVFCKESLHHFPRPYLALYEMTRVARRAIVLIEPNDPANFAVTRNPNLKNLFGYIFVSLKSREFKFSVLKSLFRIKLTFNNASWEPSSNYTYTFSSRDIEKFVYGLNLAGRFTKGLNDHYIEGCEFEPSDPKVSKIFAEIIEKIDKKNIACKDGSAEPDLLMHVIVKDANLMELSPDFVRKGWNVHHHQPNPYFKKSQG